MSPFPYIKEICNIEKINGFNDLLKILEMIFSIIPWTEKPYIKQIEWKDIERLYQEFKAFQTGGWCGLNAEFFKWIMEGYRQKDPLNLKYNSYNFGLSNMLPEGGSLSHIGVLVELNKLEYYFDPYFARYFTDLDGYPLQFKDLLYYIGERKFDKYKSIFLPIKKPVVKEGTVEYYSPKQLFEGSFDFYGQHNLKITLRNIFGTENFDSLMLIKIPD